MTIKEHESEYYHINKNVMQRIIVTLIGLTILTSTIMSAITLNALIEPQAQELCYKEAMKGSDYTVIRGNEVEHCKNNYLPLACPWFIIVFAISLVVGLLITAIGFIGCDNLW